MSAATARMAQPQSKTPTIGPAFNYSGLLFLFGNLVAGARFELATFGL
jgi:hypothetical protein